MCVVCALWAAGVCPPLTKCTTGSQGVHPRNQAGGVLAAVASWMPTYSVMCLYTSVILYE